MYKILLNNTEPEGDIIEISNDTPFHKHENIHMRVFKNQDKISAFEYWKNWSPHILSTESNKVPTEKNESIVICDIKSNLNFRKVKYNKITQQELISETHSLIICDINY